jgi:hypothetical protein
MIGCFQQIETAERKKKNHMELQFKGNGIQFLKNVFLYILATAPLLSLCLMGAVWLRLCLSIIVLSMILLPITACLISRIDGFSFNDERQAIVRRIGREIPYSSIKRLNLNETAGMLQVGVQEGAFRSVSIASSLGRSEKARLQTEFAERIPSLIVREKAYADWKSLIFLNLLILSLTAAFHGYLYSRHPHVRIVPRRIEWMQSRETKPGMKERSTGDYSYSLPAQFLREGIEGDVTFYADSGPEKTEFKVATRSLASRTETFSRLLRFMTGMGSYAEVLDKAYPARFGIVPLVVKDIALTGMDDIRIFSVRTKELEGYILQGSKQGSASASIMLAGGRDRAEIYFFISSPARLDEKTLQEIVTGVQLRRK